MSCMRTVGTPLELQRRRCLAVQRIAEGYSTEEVADFLGVAPRSVRRWLTAFRRRGTEGLVARPRPTPGPPPKLTSTQRL
jgi:transposase